MTGWPECHDHSNLIAGFDVYPTAHGVVSICADLEVVASGVDGERVFEWCPPRQLTIEVHTSLRSAVDTKIDQPHTLSKPIELAFDLGLLFGGRPSREPCLVLLERSDAVGRATEQAEAERSIVESRPRRIETKGSVELAQRLFPSLGSDELVATYEMCPRLITRIAGSLAPR